MSEMQLTGSPEQLFTQGLREQIDAWVAKYPAGQAQSALIPSLHILQDAHGGWLSEDIMKALAAYLDIPEISVFEVATFYTMFDLAPVGEHKVNVCTNISCQLNGAESISDHIKKRLGVGFGETTTDGKFTLKEVECLGACCDAPMLQLDKDYHIKLTTDKVDQLLDEVE
jgi:NADH-quinone oxidoreductase subunit E